MPCDKIRPADYPLQILNEYCMRIISAIDVEIRIRVTRISLCCLLCFFVPGVASSSDKIGVLAFPDYRRRRNYERDALSISLFLSLSDRIILFRSDSVRYEKMDSKKLTEIMYSSCGCRTAQHTEEILNGYEKKYKQYKKHLVFLSWNWKSQMQKRENVIRSEICYCIFQN